MKRAALMMSMMLVAHRADADCPVDVAALPPMGLVNHELQALAPGLAVDAARDGATLDAGAAAGTLVDAQHAALAASVGAQGELRRGSFAGCVSADGRFADRIGGEVSATVAVPLYFLSAVQLGVVDDEELDVSLIARPEYLRAPLTRREFHASVSFLDLEFADDDHASTTRIAVMPMQFGVVAAHQETDAMALARHELTIEASLARIGIESARAHGSLDAFVIAADELDETLPTQQSGLNIGVVQLQYTSVGPGLHALGRVGFLVHDASDPALRAANTDPMNDCTNTLEPCQRGAYRAELGWTFADGLGVSATGARTGFFATDRTFLYEDRATLGGGWHADRLDVKLDAFAARTRAFAYAGAAPALSAGGRVAVERDVGRGFLASVQGEVAHGGYATTLEPDPPTLSARVVAQLAYHFHADRTQPHVAEPPSLETTPAP